MSSYCKMKFFLQPLSIFFNKGICKQKRVINIVAHNNNHSVRSFHYSRNSPFSSSSIELRPYGTYKRALTRQIDPSLPKEALRIDDSMIDYDIAVIQHNTLITTMKTLGLEIEDLPCDGLADACFIEDTVVIAGNIAMITNPGALSRKPETARVKSLLESAVYSDLKVIAMTDKDGTLDGGDVLFTGKEFFVGESLRTNLAGIHFLAKSFSAYRVTPVFIRSFSNSILHLKSACSMCGSAHVVVGGELGSHIAEAIMTASPGVYKFTHVHDPSAANCLYINGTMIRRTREEFPKSADQLDSIGGNQICITASELEKCDAALTCCSVLF